MLAGLKLKQKFTDTMGDLQLEAFSRTLGQEIHRMWEMRASLRDGETASCGVLFSLSLKQEVC